MSTSPVPTRAASVRTVLDALGAEPARLFIAGGIGTGKSAVLEAVRRALRESGHSVVRRIPGARDAGSAVVIDDAHLLDDADLRALAALTDDSASTIVVAAEPRDQDPGLRMLATALQREGGRIALGPLTSGEISHALADPAGHPPPREVSSAAVGASAGIPFLIAAIASAAGPPTAASVRQAAGFALVERLRRLDQSDLEALLIASLNGDLGAVDLAAALDTTAQCGADLIDRARATGLLQPSHPPEFLASVHRATAHLVGATRHHELEKSLLRTQLDSDTLTPQLATEFVEHGIRDESLLRWLRVHSAGSVRTLQAAVAAGASDLKAALADALALRGDTPTAGALADELLTSPQSDERAAGVRIAAGVAAHNGNYAHAAELFDWLGSYPDAMVGSAAALVHVATGDLPAARAALDAGRGGPPTAATRAARGLAEGVLLTIEGPYPAAAVRLGQSLAVEHSAGVVMPDSAAALAILAALHSGDPTRARSVADRAVGDDREPTGSALFRGRHRLLRGWARMQDGQLSAAVADADSVEAPRGRDALWAAALRTGVARRSGDTGALQAHWSAGMEALAEYSVDLFSLLPVGELWIAGARLRRQELLGPAVEQGFGLLTALGEPIAWAPVLHWAGVHAGIAAADPAAVAPHGQALTAMAAHSPFAAALAAAGRSWLKVLANQVDADEVVAAARGLARFGLTSDATRLAAQAALQAQDGKVSGLMLQAARDLKLAAGLQDQDDRNADPDGGTGTPQRRPLPVSTTLSDREREVAELLLLGKPYRDIGAQLFISAKTVEHHVARIRRRLGAESRSEMLSMLRATLALEAGR